MPVELNTTPEFSDESDCVPILLSTQCYVLAITQAWDLDRLVVRVAMVPKHSYSSIIPLTVDCGISRMEEMSGIDLLQR